MNSSKPGCKIGDFSSKFLKVKEYWHVLSQEILKSSFASQAVNGVYMYPNTQYKNKNQGQGVS